MVLTKFGLLLMIVGGLISVLFWLPKLVNHKRLKEILGPKYKMIYFIYFANGPFLLVMGYYLYQH